MSPASPPPGPGNGTVLPPAATRPGTAARARTLAAHATSASLELPGGDERAIVPAARLVEPDGGVLLLVPPHVGAAVHTAEDDLAAVLHLVDVAPVAVPHRVRAHCWIAGWLTVPTGPGTAGLAARLAALSTDPAASPHAGAVVRLEAGEVLVDDLWGAAHVEPDEYALGAPDPLAAHEAPLLQHLATAHAAELCALAAAAVPGGCDDDRVAPVCLDRFGIRLRVGGPARTRDIRFDFDAPVDGPRGFGDALRRLLHGVHR